jgi:hypothetical protein
MGTQDDDWEYYDRKTFWPRPSNMPSPLTEDIRCEQCGYDLRGLTYGHCPECGHAFNERTIFGTRLPWIHRKVIGANEAFWRTASLVIARPVQFARDAAGGTRLVERDGTYFRWLVMGVAFVPALVLAGFGIVRLLSGEAMVLALVASTVLLLLWLDGISRVPVSLFRHQYLASDRLERVVAMSHYTCAPLVLTPLHLPVAGLFLISRTVPGYQHVFVAIAVLAWLTLGAVQAGLWIRAAYVLSRRTMGSSGGNLLFLIVAIVMGWTWKTVIYLLALPALLWWSAKYLKWI